MKFEISGEDRMNPGNTVTGWLELVTMPGLKDVDGRLPLGIWKADDKSPGFFGTSGGGGG